MNMYSRGVSDPKECYITKIKFPLVGFFLLRSIFYLIEKLRSKLSVCSEDDLRSTTSSVLPGEPKLSSLLSEMNNYSSLFKDLFVHLDEKLK